MKKCYLVGCLLLLSLSCTSSTSTSKDIGLKVGENAPDVTLTSADGKSFNFSKQSKDTIAVFYRGSW